MFMLIVEFKIKPEFSDKFNLKVLKQAQNSLNREQECHFFEVTRTEDNPDHFILSEVYTDSVAFEYHLESDHFLSFDIVVKEWIIEKSVRSLQ